MFGIINGVGYACSSLDHETKFRYSPDDHHARADAERAAQLHGEKIAADREAKAGRPLTRQEMMFGLGYETITRDQWEPQRRPKDKYDTAIAQLDEESPTEDIGKLMAMSTPERLKYFARKLQAQAQDKAEAEQERQLVDDDPKLVELRQLREQIKFDGSYSDAERLAISRSIRQLELGTDGVAGVADSLYQDVKDNQRARVGAEADLLAAEAAEVQATLAHLKERQEQLWASLQPATEGEANAGDNSQQ